MSRLLRRAAFQIHLWAGVSLGAYVVVISITGAALVFRSDLQRATVPDVYRDPHPAAPRADVEAVARAFAAAYPEHQLVGVDAPYASRPSYLAYLTNARGFITVFADASSGAVLGALPEESWIVWLQNLHASLLGGQTGRTANGIGALCILAMAATGLIIWWPGAANWREGLVVRTGRRWPRVVWETHRAVGIWTAIVLLMWAATGAVFGFSSTFRAAVNRLSPLTRPPRVESDPARKRSGASVAIGTFVMKAKEASPTSEFVRIVMPASDRAPFLVVLTPAGVTRTLDGSNVDYYFDQYTGAPLLVFDHAPRTAGDRLVASIAPLHIGTFGGTGVKIAWAVLGLSPSLLFATGLIVWFRRVVLARDRA